jgi:3-methyladenine DNA glycosylase Tag
MADPLGQSIVRAFDNVIKRELAEEGLVRDEIKLRGTWWAAQEIWKLRRRIAGLERRVREVEGRRDG